MGVCPQRATGSPGVVDGLFGAVVVGPGLCPSGLRTTHHNSGLGGTAGDSKARASALALPEAAQGRRLVSGSSVVSVPIPWDCFLLHPRVSRCAFSRVVVP